MNPFLGEIRMFAGYYAPQPDWALCDGRRLSISGNSQLFELLGTLYGGNIAQDYFNLPNLQGRVPIHMGQGDGLPNYQLAETGGTLYVGLDVAAMPAHNHTIGATDSGEVQSPSDLTLPAVAVAPGVMSQLQIYGNADPDTILHDATIGNSDGGQPHANVQPFLTINFIIALSGIIPDPPDQSEPVPNADKRPAPPGIAPDVFQGEIRVFPFKTPPDGWASCDGQILPIQTNTGLFSIIGTSYGGNGTSNFALPNLIGAIPVCAGDGPGLPPYVIGEFGGEESVVLGPFDNAVHNHLLAANTTPGSTANPNLFMRGVSIQQMVDEAVNYLTAQAPDTVLSSGTIDPAGGGAPHNNMMPYLALNFCIALQGIFPNKH